MDHVAKENVNGTIALNTEHAQYVVFMAHSIERVKYDLFVGLIAPAIEEEEQITRMFDANECCEVQN